MPEFRNDQVDQVLKEAEDRLASAQLRQTDAENRLSVFEPRVAKSAASVKFGSSKHIQPDLTLRNPGTASIVSQEKNNAGPGWFGLPEMDLNDKHLKRDIQLLGMRGTALDPHRHYKKDSMKPRMPRYAHIGRILEGPTEFYSSRLTRRARKRTLVQELMSAEIASGKFRSKYHNIQTHKSSGKKAFYKKLVSHRRRRN
ncbi:hypothetical protein ACRALDRAFT_1070410 [Sodiomyces alcalophilus JCM 7366]|uniref:uncharacterized protein n=1 Tax=Sodiomyces alcalophilus JCM 7366 TaxID=591952 RepID=UPI0039B4FC50